MPVVGNGQPKQLNQTNKTGRIRTGQEGLGNHKPQDLSRSLIAPVDQFKPNQTNEKLTLFSGSRSIQNRVDLDFFSYYGMPGFYKILKFIKMCKIKQIKQIKGACVIFS